MPLHVSDFEKNMDVSKLVLDYIEVLAWPIVVLVIILLFKKKLHEVLSRLEKADLPGGVKINFREEIRLAKKESEEVEDLEPPEKKRDVPIIPLTEANSRMIDLGLRPSPSGMELDYYRLIAKSDPNLALAGLRMEIELMLKNLVKGYQLDVNARTSISGILKQLYDANAITLTQSGLVERITRICNAAVHGQRVTESEANGIIEIAETLANQFIDWLSWYYDEQA